MTQIQGTIIATTSNVITTNDTVTNEPVELLLTSISTAHNLKAKHRRRQIEDAKRARKFQNKIGATTAGVLWTIDLNNISISSEVVDNVSSDAVGGTASFEAVLTCSEVITSISTGCSSTTSSNTVSSLSSNSMGSAKSVLTLAAPSS